MSPSVSNIILLRNIAYKHNTPLKLFWVLFSFSLVMRPYLSSLIILYSPSAHQTQALTAHPPTFTVTAHVMFTCRWTVYIICHEFIKSTDRTYSWELLELERWAGRNCPVSGRVRVAIGSDALAFELQRSQVHIFALLITNVNNAAHTITYVRPRDGVLCNVFISFLPEILQALNS